MSIKKRYISSRYERGWLMNSTLIALGELMTLETVQAAYNIDGQVSRNESTVGSEKRNSLSPPTHSSREKNVLK
jgi:hypothetical protein